MKVWEIKDQFGLENLMFGERPDPGPGPGQVVVRLRAASLNYRDVVVIGGGYGPNIKPPLIPLSDGFGEVEAVGVGVERVAVGDRVCPLFFQSWMAGDPPPDLFQATLGGPLDGVLAERIVVDQQGVVKIPGAFSPAEAACLPCAGLTAWSALVVQGGVTPGQTVLIQGTGGVALFALQFAKMLGARAIVTSSSDEKLSRAHALGADATINYRATPRWDRDVKDLTNGEGCDHVIDVGGADTLEQSLRSVRVGGRISLIGVLSGAEAKLTLPLVVMRNLRLQGVTVGHRDGFEAMVRALELHGVRPVVDRVYGFSEAKEALNRLAAGAHFGKICIET